VGENVSWENISEETSQMPIIPVPLPKLRKLFEVMEIRRVKVFVHWSVLLIGAIILIGAVNEPLLSFVVLISYYGVIFNS